jgi:hypothetical protein
MGPRVVSRTGGKRAAFTEVWDMKVLRLFLVGVAGILLGASVNEAGRGSAPSPVGMEEHCVLTAREKEATTLHAEQHPCDWVETCRYPCDGKASECCHGDWNCPPNVTLPRS